MSDAVKVQHDDGVAVVTIDDGKANALSATVIADLNAALDDADADPTVRAVLIAGRPGMLSGGFDLKVMKGDDAAAIGRLVTSGGELVSRLFGSPLPVVCACTGHAIAAGALLLLGSHHRVGAAGEYQIRLIETAIGMVLPDWAVIAAEERLNRSHLQPAVVESRVYDPGAAQEAGFLDQVVEAGGVLDAALEEAARLAALPGHAYAGNAAKLRGGGSARLATAIATDRAAIERLAAG